MNKTKNTNAAIHHPVITIRVVEVDLNRNIVLYTPFLTPQAKPWTFRASIQIDRNTIRHLQPGKGYAIAQTVDVTNTTHWAASMPYSSGPHPAHSVIVSHTEARRAKAEAAKNPVTETHDFMVF